MPTGVARVEWPSGFTIQDILVGAGRVERELNSNGDPTYVGYAPRADSRTDAEGWLIEYYVYNASNKLLTIHRRAGLSWNERSQILPLVHVKDIPPALGTIRITGVSTPKQWKRGTAFGSTMRIVQVGLLTPTRPNVARAFGQVRVNLVNVTNNSIGRGRAVAQLAVSGTVRAVNRNRLISGQVKVLANVIGREYPKRVVATGQVKLLGSVTGTYAP